MRSATLPSTEPKHRCSCEHGHLFRGILQYCTERLVLTRRLECLYGDNQRQQLQPYLAHTSIRRLRRPVSRRAHALLRLVSSSRHLFRHPYRQMIVSCPPVYEWRLSFFFVKKAFPGYSPSDTRSINTNVGNEI